MSDLTDSVVPPQSFVGRLNEHRPDGELLTPLSPLAMLIWDQVRPKPGPLILITGI